MSENNGGDVLAKGGIRCQFRVAGSNVSQEHWDSVWAEDTDESKNSRSDADLPSPGNVGTEPGAVAGLSGV